MLWYGSQAYNLKTTFCTVASSGLFRQPYSNIHLTNVRCAWCSAVIWKISQSGYTACAKNELPAGKNPCNTFVHEALGQARGISGTENNYWNKIFIAYHARAVKTTSDPPQLEAGRCRALCGGWSSLSGILKSTNLRYFLRNPVLTPLQSGLYT